LVLKASSAFLGPSFMHYSSFELRRASLLMLPERWLARFSRLLGFLDLV
jgi:hypothetical protein